MSNNSHSKSNKLFFIDFLKAISIIAVVSFHGIFVPANTYSDSASLLEIVFAPLRFCVPVFFTISFFLYELSETKKPSKSFWLFMSKRYTRLVYPVLFWFAIASILNLAKGNSLAEIAAALIQGEIFTGSYYLLALIQLLPLFYWWRKILTAKVSLLLSLAIQTAIAVIIYFALQAVFWSGLIDWLRLANRPLIFYWLIYLAMGIYIARNFDKIQIKSRNTPKPIKLFALLFLSLLFWRDYQFLVKITDGAIAPFDYLTLSSVLSVPIIFFCFSSVEEKHLPAWLRQPIEILAKYSLGIFCINGILRLVFLSIASSLYGNYSFQFYEILIIKLLGWLILLLISLFLSILLDRLSLTKTVC